MQLGNYHALSTVDNECTVACHVRNSTEEHVLDDGSEILVVGIGTKQLHLSLQRHTICKATLQTLVYGVTRRINIVIQELKNEVIASIGDREVLSEHLIQTVILAFFRRSFQL